MNDLISNLSLLLVVGVSVITAALILLVLGGNKRSATNMLFALLGTVIIAWLLTMHMSLRPQEVSKTLFWIRLSLFWAVGINSLFLLLSYTIPLAKFPVSKAKVAILSVSSAIVMALTVSSLVFSNADIINNTVSPNPGPAIPIFVFYIVILTGITIKILISRILKSSSVLKRQLIIVLLGISLMLGLIVTTIVVPMAISQNSTFVPLFPLYTLLFTGFTAYAIVKHKLFDIKVIAAQALTVILWIILFSKLFIDQTLSELAVDFLILLTSIVFGILLIRSVSNEVKQREKLQELTDKLKALDKQKDEFISMAAHELRAPMTAIKGYVSMIMDGDTGEIPEKTRGYLMDVNSVNDRLVRLVNNMLNVSRIEEGRLLYNKAVVRLSDIANDVYTSFRFEAERKGLTFKVSFPQNIKDHVEVDPDRLNEVIGNFVSNAVKYTEKGGIEIIISHSRPEHVKLTVKDTGPGISIEERKKLFQKFYRVQSTSGKTIGTGLGLYISKLLVEKFGGKLGLDSKVGKGSEFWIELPLSSKTLSSEEKN